MKKYLFFLIAILSQLQTTFADQWVLIWIWDGKNYKGDNATGTERIRTGDINMWDIPLVIRWAIDYLMWFAATVAVIFIIIWAYQILFWSIEQNRTKWRDTIIMALGGFAIAALSWFIIKLILDNFS